jgi:hypothetical protein
VKSHASKASGEHGGKPLIFDIGSGLNGTERVIKQLKYKATSVKGRRYKLLVA